MPSSRLPHHVRVLTTARLHMGFLDLHGGLGRRFGSIGLALDKPATRLTAVRAADITATGPGAARAVACARSFAKRAGIPEGAHFTLEEAIPEHAGLGSGTQMALAVGMAMNRLHGLGLTLREVAAISGRGTRSGIGIGAFAEGGLLVDGGRGEHTTVPPVIARMAFPATWHILLIYDRTHVGVHGGQEIAAFHDLPEFPAATAAELCRRVIMQALPALAEQDLAVFGAAINEIQCCIGDYFAAAQGGGRFASISVAAALDWMRAQGVHCLGQSSWGPTGFAVLESEAQALEMQEALSSRLADVPGLALQVCRARNTGSEVQAFYEDDLVDAA